MKIDMLSVSTNFPKGTQEKGKSSEANFLAVLDTNMENNNMLQGEEDSEEVQEDLVALLSALLNRLNDNSETINNEGSNSEELRGLAESINHGDLGSTPDLNSILSNNEVVELLNKVSETSEEGQIIYKLLEKLIHTEVTNKDDDNKGLTLNDLDTKILEKNSLMRVIEKAVNGDLGKETSNNIQGEISFYDELDFIKYKEGLNLDDSRATMLETSNSKHRSVLNETSLNTQDDLSILNRIAFSNTSIEESTKIAQPMEVRQGYITEDVLQAVKYLNNKGIEELNIKMNPRDLGEISIKLLKSEGESKLIIKIDNKETFNLINSNISDIENHLNNLNIKVKEVLVQVKSDNQNDFSGNLNQQFNKNNSNRQRRNQTASSQVHTREESVKTDESNINLLI